jgi:dephospho-CoA kinase
MGKSTAAGFLEEQGVQIIDTDSSARELTAPGASAVRDIAAAFGREMVTADGALRRSELAKLVFEDETKRRQLERLLHPQIRDRWKSQLAQWQESGKSHVAVVIPLLFETDAAGEFDVTICVAGPAALQEERLRERGWSDRQIKLRIAAQLPTKEKMLRSNYVLWNGATLEILREQVVRVLRRL